MIEIISDKDKLLKSLQELEFEFAQGNVSKEAYDSQKRQLIVELETFEAADRVKRLQGKEDTERPLEYWEERKKEEEALEEKEKLMKKFLTASPGAYTIKSSKDTNKGINKGRIMALALLAVIFCVGIGFGVFLMKVPSESAAVPMMVNDSAFPVFNNTTTTNITQNITTSVISNGTNDNTNNVPTNGSGSSTG